MSKLGSALGKKYEENRLSVLTRSFELGDHTFKVRVPSVQEIEAIYNYFKNPNEEKVELEYQKMLKEFYGLKEKEGVEIKDNDFIIDGRSVKETAKKNGKWQHRITD